MTDSRHNRRQKTQDRSRELDPALQTKKIEHYD